MVLHQIVGGIRQAMGYCAPRHRGDEQARFVRISGAGPARVASARVTITKDAPNYRRG